ncbi:MAG: hypothetical protein JNK12_12940 [Acidimicrobiales bacterium]|nr:hypothetical protein [Acidimicrobiales bacterium]
MGRIDDVLDGVRAELRDEHDVPDVRSAVEAMVRAYRQATTEKAVLTGSAVARLLGVSRQAVHQRASRGSLLAVADADGVRYPMWQFRDGEPVPGLLHLVRSSRDAGVDDAALASWIESDEERLAAIAAGDLDALLAHVEEARVRKTSMTRRRVAGPARRLTDEAAS